MIQGEFCFIEAQNKVSHTRDTGVYPSKPLVRTNISPEPLSIMGNEGCGIVRGFNDGEEVGGLKIGDRGQ